MAGSGPAMTGAEQGSVFSAPSITSALLCWRFGRGGGKPRLAPEAGSLAAASAGSRPSKGPIQAALQVNAVPAGNGLPCVCFYFVRAAPANSSTRLAVVECLKSCQWTLAGLENITPVRRKNIESKLCPPVETLPPAGPA